MSAILDIKGLRKQFGGVTALSGVDLSINEGEILGVVGPNGSGKSTLFNVVTGVHKPTAGSVTWKGKDITGIPANQVSRNGIGYTFQQAMAFPGLTVLENVQIATEHSAASARTDFAWPTPASLLEFVGIPGLSNERAGILPFGSLRLLGLALALATRPSLLLLDEPAAGLNDREMALNALEKSREERFNWLPFVQIDPVFKNLRSEARFIELERSLGLTEKHE